MATSSIIAEHLLRQAIVRNVSEKLGSFTREISEFTDGLSDQEKEAGKLMILEMTRQACTHFCNKMEQRIRNGK